MGASVGFAGKLGISASDPVDASFDFISESFRKVKTHIVHAGVHGLRGQQSERIREANYSVAGSIVMEPTPEELAALLPWILGANASGTTFALAETLPARYVTIDRVAKVMTYAGVKVNQAVFEGSEGSTLRLTLDLVGITETVGNAASFPSLTNTAAPPFMFSDLAILINSNVEAIKSYRLTVNNGLVVAYNNSQSASFIVPGERTVMLDMGTPYSSTETDLYDLTVAGVPVVATFTNGGYSIVFTTPKFQTPAQSPAIDSKQTEIGLPLSGQCRRSGTTQELTVTLDSTA